MYDGAMTKGVATELDPLSLERQVCFALAITNRAVLAVYRPLLEPLGLTHPQYLGDADAVGQRESRRGTAHGQGHRGVIADGFGHPLADAQTAAGPGPADPGRAARPTCAPPTWS